MERGLTSWKAGRGEMASFLEGRTWREKDVKEPGTRNTLQKHAHSDLLPAKRLCLLIAIPVCHPMKTASP